MLKTLLSTRLLSNNLETKIYKTIGLLLPVVQHGWETGSLTLRLFEKNIWPRTDENRVWRRRWPNLKINPLPKLSK